MNTMFKTMTVLGALSVGGLGLGSVAWAQSGDAAAAQQPGIDCPGPGPGMMGRQGGPGRRFDADREFTADQIRVLTEARLIRMGDDDELKVGEIRESTAKSYSVQLLKADGTVARTIELAKNGMPMGCPK